jgi:response regulator RpfG family c-di-GMP phosphodiesterase
MPILDGWGFMEEWQQHLADRYKYVRIYICTSSLDNEDVNRSREYTHVKDYIVKPIKAEVIERIVMEVLAF